MRPLRGALALVLGIALASGSCSSGGSTGGSGGGCPRVNQDCPATPPSYSATVAPVIAARCLPCHMAGGLASDKPYGDYMGVYRFRTTALSQLASCKMPPATSAQLTAKEKASLVAWFACGAPDN